MAKWLSETFKNRASSKNSLSLLESEIEEKVSFGPGDCGFSLAADAGASLPHVHWWSSLRLLDDRVESLDFELLESAVFVMRILEGKAAEFVSLEISDDLVVGRRERDRDSREMLVKPLGASRIRLDFISRLYVFCLFFCVCSFVRLFVFAFGRFLFVFLR